MDVHEYSALVAFGLVTDTCLLASITTCISLGCVNERQINVSVDHEMR
jgi:hypothetical protein